MHRVRHVLSLATLTAAAIVLTGCATEKAYVTTSYVLNPSKGLPPGMTAIAVMDARVNEVTDRKWSELAANMIQDRIQEANTRYGANVKIADRKHLADGMAEQDLAAAGITVSDRPGRGGKVMAVQGIIESEINVKVETHRGADTTIAGLGGFGGRGHGGGNLEMREVETVARNITVQTAFKLVDTINNRNWLTYAPEPYHEFDKTETSPLFGSSKTEAELTPRDTIIRHAVNKGVDEFVSEFVPCRIRSDMVIVASGGAACNMGVKMLRADAWPEALRYFKDAMAENPTDDRAAYGAGIASEASGQYDDAIDYYRRAYGISSQPEYRAAKERLADHAHRIRGGGTWP